MRKIVQALLFAGALLCHGIVSAQSSVVIGTSTTTSQRQPLGTYWGFERSAAIYHAADIGRSGVIEKLSWYTNLSKTRNAGIRIYLKHTTDNNFAAASSWANITSGARLVMADSGFSITAGQWSQFTLDDTFSYSNTENLMVMVEINHGGTGDGAGTATTTARHTSTSATFTNTHQTWNADNTPPAGTGGRNSNRPNLTINFVPDPIPDLDILSILSPSLAGCNVASYNLQFRVGNVGGANVSSGSYIRYNYTLNSGSVVLDSFQLGSALLQNGNVDHSVVINNTSGVSVLNFALWVDIDADNYKDNDSAFFTVNNPTCISSNYQTDFESGAGSWTANTLWQHGTIAKGNLNNPPSGSQGFITNLVGNYPSNVNASLYSPYFDFSISCNPILSWAMRFDTENNWDGMIVEASSDDVNWTKITSITPTYNNNSNNGPIPAPKFSGDNGSWNTFVADLSGFSGQSTVRVRFRFGSDGSGTDNGFAIDDVQFTLYPSYSASFIAPDTVFINALYDKEIENTSPIQTGVNYRWVYDGAVVGVNYDLDFSFPTAGAQNLILRAVDPCGAVLDSVVKTIQVITPSQAAVADFVSDVNIVSQFGTVNYTNLSENGPTYYEWFVSPAVWVDPITNIQLPSVSYDNGTTLNSKSPVMSFFGTGEYDICLIAENSVGRDTLCKTDYILVGGNGGGGSDSVMCSGTGVDASVKPSGRVYDSGGPNGNYQDGEGCTFTIDFSCYDSLYMDFSAFNLEANFDFLQIFDGDQATGTPLWDVNGDPDGITGTTIVAIPAATSGKVTLFMDTDGSVTRPGFVLNYRAASPITSILADFDAPDTICATYPVTFTNKSEGAQFFEWDFFGNGSNNSTAENPTFTYANGGTFNVRLIVKGCAGEDTVYKTIVVNNPGQNVVAFSSPYTTYTTNDVVNLNNETNGCVDDFEWKIEPNRATFLNNTRFSPNAEVMFDTAGVYTVTLITTNSAGTDSLVRTNYITINSICLPKVDNNLPDMGIVRVILEDIDNSSATNLNYTDYPDQSTELMKGATYEVRVQRQTTSNEITRKVWADWNADGDFDDAGELIASDGPSRSILLSQMFTVPRNAADGMVTMRVATSYGNQANDPCGNRAYGETEDYRLILFADPVAPVLTLIGSDTVIINRNDSYTELGATANDNLDGALTTAILISSNVDTAVAGTYQVNYSVSDTASNTTTLIRTVIVLPDAPTMTLNGSAVDTIEVFSAYIDLGVDAFDFNNQQLQVSVDRSLLDTAVVGNYTVFYTATDQNGRSTTIARQVRVLDRTAPLGTLIGADTLVVEVFGDLKDPGILTSDNYCAVNTYLPSNVDLNTLGYKTLTYTVEDCFGNTSTVDRVIQVVDTEAPVISLSGGQSANVIRLRTYVDEGYTLSDNYNTATEITIDTITTLVNTYNVGLYTWQYVATDVSGNSSKSEIRFIYVIDNVGIADIQVFELEAYPNPNRGHFSLKASAFSGDKVNIRVTDMNGKIVHMEDVQNFSGEHALSLDNATPGVYLVHVIQGNQQAVTKIVINK